MTPEKAIANGELAEYLEKLEARVRALEPKEQTKQQQPEELEAETESGTRRPGQRR